MESRISSFLTFLPFVFLAALTLPGDVKSSCYPNKKQICDVGDETHGSWNTSMRFFLFTRNNYKNPEMLHMCNGHLPKHSNFKPQNRLIVFIPGFLFGLCELTEITEIKNELLVKGDFNVLLIDDRNEIGVDYVVAKTNLPEIAGIIAKVLQNIQVATGITNDNIYLIGHSFGAHIAGYVGNTFKVHRITGLDPAGIDFPEENPSGALDSSDAELVDILHCSGGKDLPYLGIDYPAGHADFYINGGTDQPSCAHSAWEAAKNFDFLFVIGTTILPTICSHAICLEFYELSINNKFGNFTAWSCDSYDDFVKGRCPDGNSKSVNMGFNFEDYFTPIQRAKPFPRKYYLQTSASWPYVNGNGTYRSAQ